MANIKQLKLPDNTTYDLKDNSGSLSSHWHHDEDLKPLISKTYASTSYYASANTNEDATWLFMSVKPDDWYKPWTIKFKVYSYCPSYVGYKHYTYSTITGRSDGAIYCNWNEKYNAVHTYISGYLLKKAGFDAGYGHAIGINIVNADNRTSSAYYRTFEIDYYECENCTVEFLETPVKWANWTGTGTTYYNGIVNWDATNRGLRESGDDNELNQRVQYFSGKTGAVGIWGGSLFMQDGNGTYQNICTASDGTVTSANRTTATTKIANTHGFTVGSPIYYCNANYNANTQISGSAVVYTMLGTLFDSRYAFNTTLTANSLTPYASLYLVGTINATDGLYYLDQTWWTQTPNDTSKIYVLVGACYDSTTSNCRIVLYEQNKWFKYNGSKLVEICDTALHCSDANTVNGHTVNSDVPANAVFTDTIPSGYCTTASGTAAKVAECTDYSLASKSFIEVIMKNANTSAGAITLNINGKGAKPIYINGSASSASNYTLPAGSYFVYYDGTNYYFRTDGKLTTSGLDISGPTTATMTYASNNPQIQFSENGAQGVKIIYSDYDSYRAPYGLKVIGDGSNASGAWFEVEGDLYAKNLNATNVNANLNPEKITSGYLESRVYYNTHPENNGGIIPFIYNDIAFLTSKGGSYTYYSTTDTDYTADTLSGTTITTSLTNAFDASPSYAGVNRPQTEVSVIDITCHKVFTYSNVFYIDFGASAWRAKSVTLLVRNSNTETTWTQKGTITNNAKGHWWLAVSHTSTSGGSTVQGFNQMRIVLTDWNSTQSRIAQIGLINYGSYGVNETFISRGGCNGIYGSLIPNANDTFDLGSSSKKWKNGYFTNINGVAVGNSPKFTDTQSDWNASSGLAQILNKPTLGTAAAKNYTTSVTSGSSDLVTSGAVYTAIADLPEPMVLKGTLGTGGTITSLPTASASNEGYTYKVITAGTYASQAAKVGDLFVSYNPSGSTYSWLLIPSGDETTSDTWRNIKVNGTEKLGNAISTGAVDFVNGTGTEVSFDATGNKVSINSTYASEQEAESGTAVSLVTTGEKYDWNHGIEKALIHKEYNGTNVYVVSGDVDTQSWYFMSVRPDSYGESWSVKCRVLSYCANNPEQRTDTLMEISQATAQTPIEGCARNYQVPSSSHYRVIPRRVTSAGYTAGYGQAIGILLNAGNPGSENYRTIIVDIFRCENCSVTLLNTPVKWSEWTGASAENYIDYSSYLSNIGLYSDGYISSVTNKVYAYQFSGSSLMYLAMLPGYGDQYIGINHCFGVNTNDGYMQIAKEHTSTTSVDSGLWCGNNIAAGTAGAVRGILNLFAANGKANYILPAENSADRLYTLPTTGVDATLALMERTFPCYVGLSVGTLDEFVNLLARGNGRSFSGTVKFTADVGVGISANIWTRVIMMSQNAPNNGTYDVGMFALFLPNDSSLFIQYAIVQGTTAGNYTVQKTGNIVTNTYEGTVQICPAGNGQLNLGNNLAANNSKKSTGRLVLYSDTGNYYSDIKATGLTNTRHLLCPDKGGTIAVTSDIVNDKVYQENTAVSTAANYRVLLSANANNTSETNSVRKCGDLIYNPSLKRLILNSTSSGMIEAPSNQLLYLRASNEANFGLIYGVRKNGSSSYWALAPETNGGGSYTILLGGPNYRWGQIYSTNSTISTSDRTEKKDIVPLDAEDSVNFIMALNPVSYKFITGNSDRTHYGMIAQDVEEELEELGMTAKDFAGFCKDQKTVPFLREENGCQIKDDMPVEGEYTYGLRYEEFIAPTIKTVQVLKNRIDEQQQEIDELKQQLAEIQAMLNGGN